MEILSALILLIIGGYALGNYFLLVAAITAKTKKGKVVGFVLFSLWLLIPVFNYAQEEIRNYFYQQELESNSPTEDLVKEAFREINHSYVQLPKDFYTYQEQELSIKIDVLEQEFINHAREQYNEIKNYVDQHDFENKAKKIDELMIEDVFVRYLFHVNHLHYQIWNKTTAPEKLNVELYFEDKVILKTVSKDHQIQEGHESLIPTIEQFYQSLKPKIIEE